MLQKYVAITALFAIAPSSTWAQTYSLSDLGVLPDGDDVSYATGINESGQVVGISGSGWNQRGFIWDSTNGTQALDPLNGDALSNGYAINDAGVVVGMSENPPIGGFERAAIWQSGFQRKEKRFGWYVALAAMPR